MAKRYKSRSPRRRKTPQRQRRKRTPKKTPQRQRRKRTPKRQHKVKVKRTPRGRKQKLSSPSFSPQPIPTIVQIPQIPQKPKSCPKSDAPEQMKNCNSNECIFPSEIIPGLYLGEVCSRHPNVLNYLGVKNIVTVSGEDVCYPSDNKYGFVNICFNWGDDPSQRLYPEIDKIADFINHKMSKGEKVFVHCHAGISRSASVIIYYLMKYKKMDFVKAYEFVKSKRDVIGPNLGFLGQLVKLSQKLGYDLKK